MVTPTLAVVGIGNAIVDVIAAADDDFLIRHGMNKGGMMLIDEPQAEALYREMGSTTITSGGSAANTIAGIASLGGATAFIGKVRDDALGAAFRHDLTAVGARYTTPAATSGPATARCLILVTADAQRTMNTYLGACVELSSDDLDITAIADAAVTYLEGYLFDAPAARAAFEVGAAAAHDAGRKVSLSLSDAFCVERHRTAFVDFIARHVDILFANAAEIRALFDAEDEGDAIERARAIVDVAAITRDARGSVIVAGDRTIDIAPVTVTDVVDTTGAGDLYAAGFLYGYANGASLDGCGALGSRAAARILTHFGARPERPLRDLVTPVAQAHDA